MSNPYYAPRIEAPPTAPIDVPRSFQLEATRPQDYVAEDGLVAAVNTAVMLGQPLLLTGEPGTGKTQLAASVAYQLGYPKPLRFDCKSTSQARDVFYTFDALGRFKAPAPTSNEPTAPSSDAVRFIHYNALGLAILYANPKEQVAHLMPRGMPHPGPVRSVILIDEIDKAPRDFPNDLLAEIEGMSFFISELHATVRAAELQPIVIITSNSERDLPDAFLRRCAYYDIPFPSRETLVGILRARLHALQASDSFINDALDLFERLRSAALTKKPATAELLGWMTVLSRAHRDDPNPLADRTRALSTLGALLKNREDMKTGRRVVEAWATR